MEYELSIARFGQLATFLETEPGSVTLPDQDRLRTVFRSHLDRVKANALYKEASTLVFKRGGEIQRPIADSLDDATIFPGMPDPSPEYSTDRRILVGLLPSQKVKINVGDMHWMLRIRASMTACSLQEMDGRAKLWWTFEGVPANLEHDKRPGDEAVKNLFNFTRDLEKDMMPLLVQAYGQEVAKVPGVNGHKFAPINDRISISMADVFDRDISEFLGATHFDGYSLQDVEKWNGPATESSRFGLNKFREFIRAAAPLSRNDVTNNIMSSRELVGIRGLFCDWSDMVTKRQETAGVAWRRGASRVYNSMTSHNAYDDELDEEARAFSAARPLSAMLANRKILGLEDLSNKFTAPIMQ